MRVLYVSSVDAADSPSLSEELASLDPSLEVHVVSGAASALAEIRTGWEYGAVFLAPELPPNESLALVATLRRDHVPVAVIAIIAEDQRGFLAQAFAAGADDVLVAMATGLVAPEETLRRARQSHHHQRSFTDPPLRVLYAGQDPRAWDLLSELPFIQVERVTASADGAVPVVMGEDDGLGAPAELIVVDEDPGECHALQVVKWIDARAPQVRVVVLTSPAGGDIGGAAIDLGADDVVSKAGTYRRRLVATLHRYFRHRSAGPAGPSGPSGPRNELTSSASSSEVLEAAAPGPAGPDGPAGPEAPDESAEIARIRAAIAAEARIRDLTAEVRALHVSLEAERRVKTELQEAEAFERVLRDRDREELARLQQALTEERERRIVIEGTLRQTENRSAARVEALEAQHAAARRRLEEQLATAADRLHQVATETQVLQARLQSELTAQAAERDRFARHQLFGYALVTEAGELVRCNETFAQMFGFEHADEAVTASAGAPLAALVDHAHVVAQLQAGGSVDRVESVVRRVNGRPFHVLTSAVFRPNEDNQAGPTLIERLFFDLDDRTRLEERLRLARRLEAAGRLAAEMSAEIEPLLPAITDPDAAPDDRARVSMLVAQLLAFGRRQARPAGLLLLHEAIRRVEPRLQQVAGDDVSFETRVEDVGSVAAGEDDIEALLLALVFAARESLPYGGSILVQARAMRSGFTEQTELAVSAAGYGVHPAPISSSLERLVSRCGGTVHIGDEPARTTTLHVFLPR